MEELDDVLAEDELDDTSEPLQVENGEGDGSEDGEEVLSLEEHALIVMSILKPVTITMFIVIAIVYTLHMASAPPSR